MSLALLHINERQHKVCYISRHSECDIIYAPNYKTCTTCITTYCELPTSQKPDHFQSLSQVYLLIYFSSRHWHYNDYCDILFVALFMPFNLLR